jgi:hypothetical protein
LSVTLKPILVAGTAASHILPVTVQLMVWAAQVLGDNVVTPVDEVEQAAPVLPVTPLVPGVARQLSYRTAFT